MAQNCGGPAAPGATLLQSFTPSSWLQVAIGSVVENHGKPGRFKKIPDSHWNFPSLPKRNGTVLFFQRNSIFQNEEMSCLACRVGISTSKAKEASQRLSLAQALITML